MYGKAALGDTGTDLEETTSNSVPETTNNYFMLTRKVAFLK